MSQTDTKPTRFDTFLKNWHLISVFLCGACVVALAIGNWDLRQRTILASTAILFLRFFEEFGFPGGFP